MMCFNEMFIIVDIYNLFEQNYFRNFLYLNTLRLVNILKIQIAIIARKFFSYILYPILLSVKILLQI